MLLLLHKLIQPAGTDCGEFVLVDELLLLHKLIQPVTDCDVFVLVDELRTLIGSETTRQGVTRVFTMVQQQRLNKRLLYVILEGILETLFPHNKFRDMFHKVHSHSERVRQAGGATAATRKTTRNEQS